MWAATRCSYGDGFSNAFLNAVKSGLTSTYAIGAAAVANDPYGINGTKYDNPSYAGYNFNILTNQKVPEPSSALLLGVFLLVLGGTAVGNKIRS